MLEGMLVRHYDTELLFVFLPRPDNRKTILECTQRGRNKCVLVSLGVRDDNFQFVRSECRKRRSFFWCDGIEMVAARERVTNAKEDIKVQEPRCCIAQR